MVKTGSRVFSTLPLLKISTRLNTPDLVVQFLPGYFSGQGIRIAKRLAYFMHILKNNTMKQKFLVLAFMLVAATTVFGQARLVEKVTKKGSELVIPYEKYVLPNGLTLVVHEDHSDPVVHVDVTYPEENPCGLIPARGLFPAGCWAGFHNNLFGRGWYFR